MKKGYLVGGLAIVGAIALFMYLKPKNKANSEGFYGANGKLTTKGGSTSKVQLQCKRPNGSYYLQPSGATACVYGSDTPIRYVEN
jgi:hypothetical protein